MSEVKVGDLTIKPMDMNFKDIHPAIGVVDDVGYVGVWIPCEITGPKGKTAYKDLLWLVTSKREQILANDEILRRFGWRLAYRPIRFHNRWTLEGVKAFLNGATVDPCQVFNHVFKVWEGYMEFPSASEYVYHALWDIGTYFHHLFNAFPYHYVGGIKRCGKTKDLMLHSCLAFNAFFSNNMSTSSIYRLIQNARGTLLIDETEKLSQPDRALEFRSILLAGYKKGEKVYRIEKTRREILQPEAFEVYSPKALANIQGLEDVLEDRCKITILRRGRNKQIINKEVNTSSPQWDKLRSELYTLYLTFWKEVKEIYDEVSELNEPNELVNFVKEQPYNVKDVAFLVGRELEIWKPILALALFLDKKGCVLNKFTDSPTSLTTLMLGLAIEDAKQRHAEDMTETGEAILVQVLKEVVKENGYCKVKTLKEEMAKCFDEEQKWLTTRWIGNALRRLGFKEKRRVGTGYEYKLNRDDVQELAKRMGIEAEPEENESLSTFPESIMVSVKDWCRAYRNERSEISLEDLAKFIKEELQQEPQRVIKEAFDQTILMPSPTLGKAVVV